MEYSLKCRQLARELPRHTPRVDLVEIYSDDIVERKRDSSNSEFGTFEKVKLIFSGNSVNEWTHELG